MFYLHLHVRKSLLHKTGHQQKTQRMRTQDAKTVLGKLILNLSLLELKPSRISETSVRVCGIDAKANKKEMNQLEQENTSYCVSLKLRYVFSILRQINGV